MIHLEYATVQLAAVMCAIRFPVAAGTAPDGSAVPLADKYVLCVENLEAGAVWIPRRAGGLGVGAGDAAGAGAGAGRGRLDAAGIGHDAGVDLDGDEGPQVARDHHGQQDVEEDDDGDAGRQLLLAGNQELPCRFGTQPSDVSNPGHERGPSRGAGTRMLTADALCGDVAREADTGGQDHGHGAGDPSVDGRYAPDGRHGSSSARRSSSRSGEVAQGFGQEAAIVRPTAGGVTVGVSVSGELPAGTGAGQRWVR